VDVREPSTEGMVWIPAGEFLRGDVQGTHDTAEIKTIQNRSDEPYHRVYLDGYWIDRLPVTHREFAEFLTDAVGQGLARVDDIAVMGEFDGSRVPLYYFQSYENLIADFYATRNARLPTFLHAITWNGERFCIRSGQENQPAVDVTWFGAAAFARHRGKRLPTEAQWEKAARGADGRRFPWGNNLPTAYHANVGGHLGKEPPPAGSFSPTGDSPHGVADMLSDAFEWTGDWFNPDYYADHRAEVALRNPRGPFWGKSHAIRGFPTALYSGGSPDHVEPVSSRYDWRFEFLLGDSFANSQTTFRTVLEGEGLEPGEAPGAARQK
jgi:formylglycine-generating enzyme required for sulfatase activity